MTIKKILLLLVPSEKAYLRAPMLMPLSLGMLNAYLKSRGFHTRVLDLNILLHQKSAQIPKETWNALFDGKSILSYLEGGAGDTLENGILPGIDALLEDCDTAGFDMVGISTGANLSFFEIHFAFVLGKRIKQRWDKHVIFGGGNIQYLLEFQKEFPGLWAAVFKNFSYIISGPGEFSLAQLLDQLNRGVEPASPCTIPGILRYEDHRVIGEWQNKPFSGCPDFDQLDRAKYTVCLPKNKKEMAEKQVFKWSFPFPTAVSDKNRETLPVEERVETLVIPYIFNFDCPYKCAFCAQGSKNRPDAEPRNPSDIVEDIEILSGKYSSSFFYFFNNAFNSSREFALEFCDEVARRKLEIYWSDCARFENLDKELLEKMYRAGCRKLVFGLESASNKLLKAIGKPIQQEMAGEILKACHEVGIWCDIDVITGLPYEDESDFQFTYSFIENNFPFINSMRINKLYILPSSGFGRNPGKYGIKIHRLKNSYDRLLEKSRKIYKSIPGIGDNRFELVSAGNCYLYSFSEPGGRSHEAVFTDTGKRYTVLKKLAEKEEIPAELTLFPRAGEKK
jgi:radical SAM superfamily enzyme YgiQ (UPF0313 family)